MARATYADLIVEVRAQIDASDDVIFGWLMDRSRVLNAEAAWLLKTAVVTDGRSFARLPAARRRDLDRGGHARRHAVSALHDARARRLVLERGRLAGRPLRRRRRRAGDAAASDLPRRRG
jgi:hypothetical protein